MNSRQLQYAVKLAEARSFSQVAESLNISQPALSKQIIALEQELGVRLFDRSTSPLTLTPAGEHFIEDARELLYREDQLLRTMEEYKTGGKGRLVIGISPFRSLYLVPDVFRQLQEWFPELQIILRETRSVQLHKEAPEGQFDFAIMNLPVDEALLDVTYLEPEEIVLAVPDSMADRVPCTPAADGGYPRIRLSDCGELPFIVLSKEQEFRQLFDKLCTVSDFRPHIGMEVIGISTAWAMTRAGIGATLMPLQFLQSAPFSEGITLFSLDQQTYARQPVIVTRKGQRLSKYAKCAIDLLIASQKR